MTDFIMYVMVCLIGGLIFIKVTKDKYTVQNVIRYTVLFPISVLTFMYYLVKQSIGLYKTEEKEEK